MNQKNTNQSTKVLNPFLGFGWYTGTSLRKKNTLITESPFCRTINKKEI